MAVRSQQVSVSDTETLIAQGNPNTPVTVNMHVVSGGDSVFIGPSGVSDTDGFELGSSAASEAVTLMNTEDAVYAVTAGGGSSTLHVLEIDG